ncbi:hypothetical protein GIB67_001018 [Kingdonia uniflora]|uniref:Uncharacterized protein n=1 Tax=Kingdonia uniflora TaxID=39325 RepID=A0A7J7MFV0_9MAGN|nr:hypothetical protein GIB67_001018 [Kingdonia uniflora]
MSFLQAKLFKVGKYASGPGAVVVIGQYMYVFGDFSRFVDEKPPTEPVEYKLLISDLTQLGYEIVDDASGDIPISRVGGALAAIGDTVFLFGGRDATCNELNDLYSFETSTKIWTLLSSGDGPTERSYHLMKADDSHVYVFGGTGVNGQLNDLWVFDLNDNKWISYPDPPLEDSQESGSAYGLAVVNGKLWLVHGFPFGKKNVLCFDPIDESWTQIETTMVETPKPRILVSTDGVGQYVFVFGGLKEGEAERPIGRENPGVVFALDAETNVWRRWDEDTYDGDYLPPSGHEYNLPGGNGLAGLIDNIGSDGIQILTPYYIKDEDEGEGEGEGKEE